MAKSVPLLNVIMFADDTNLFMSGKDLKTLFKTMHDQLLRIADWFAANKLSLNVGKTKYTLFCSKKEEENLPLKLPKLCIGDQEITRTRFTKFLGVFIDENFTWGAQIDHVEKKVSKQIGIICRARKYLNNTAMKCLYNAFVHPYLNYCNIVWASTNKSKLAHIHRLQKRAIRIVSYADRPQHSRPLMIELGVLNKHEINICQSIVFMQKVRKNIVPSCLKQHFTEINHAYPTRYSEISFRENNNFSLISKFSITFRSPYIWNNISKNIINLNCSLPSFKKNVKRFLLTANQTKIWSQ